MSPNFDSKYCMNRNRLLLCRPQGGLNDILCQIGKCCDYAEKFDRTVVVDTNCHCTEFFKDSFSRYFVSTDACLVLDPAEIHIDVDSVEVHPQFITGQVGTYTARFEPRVRNFVDKETGQLLSFDFTKDYPQPLLVHHASGRNSFATTALSRLRVRDNIVGVLRERVREIGASYTGLHIRNTDYNTEFEPKIALLKGKINGPVFVATDNRDTLAHCKCAFGEERVHSFARLPVVAGETLHHLSGYTDAYQRNVDAILDLLVLALAKDFYIFELMQNRLGHRVSGFSELAANLRRSAPVLRNLIQPLRDW